MKIMKSSWKHSLMAHLTHSNNKPGPHNQQNKNVIGARYLTRIVASWVISQGVLLGVPVLAESPQQALSYSQLLMQIEQGKVSKIELDPLQHTAKVRLEGQKNN